MVDATAAGAGLARDPGRTERNIEIHVDHVHVDIATATVTSAVYVDYLQLARTREGWKFVNVLWNSVS